MTTHFSYCREPGCYCGFEFVQTEGKLDPQGDRANPKNAGFLCEHVKSSLEEAHNSTRFGTPLKRTDNGFVAASWEEALQSIGTKLKKLRKTHGADSIGVFGGPDLGGNSTGAIRTAAFALGIGSPHLYTDLHLHGASQLTAAEQMLGLPMALQADVGRAHYTVLLGSCDQNHMGWGPLQSTTIHTQALRHIQRMRRSAKLVAVGPRKTDFAEEADDYVQIRPGTETAFLLGLCHATWNGGWVEQQYLDTYCINADRLTEWLAPWTPSAVADVCGIEPGKISGIALKFSRAPMATIAKSPALFNHEHGTATAWAWHVLHAITANLLRPGGAFEAVGLVDLLPAVLAFPTKDAPKTRVSGHPAICLQMPASAIREEIQTPGKGQLKALLCVAGDPQKHHPQPEAFKAALSELELLVCIDTHPNASTEIADWILPSKSAWERADFHFLECPTLPYKYLQATDALLQPYGESRSIESILTDLYRATGASLFGGAWGTHVKGLGRWLATTNLETQANRALRWAADTDLTQLRALPHGLDKGDLDRTLWRLNTPGEKIDLAPTSLETAVRAVRPPTTSSSKPFLLTTSPISPSDQTSPQVGLHPEAGFKGGSKVQVHTKAGSISGTVRIDEHLHPEACHIAWNSSIAVGELIPDDLRDPQTGTPSLIGLACNIEKA